MGQNFLDKQPVRFSPVLQDIDKQGQTVHKTALYREGERDANTQRDKQP